MRTVIVILVAAAAASGCVAPYAPYAPAPWSTLAPANDGTTRVCVAVGLTETAGEQNPCPGADIDASTVLRWCDHFDARDGLPNEHATREGVKAAIQHYNRDMRPHDLLVVSWSGHGTRRPDASGDEADGYDEGLVCYDGIWWDDDVWKFICTLRPCRVLLVTDTCHAEGNWRALTRLATFGWWGRRRYVQLEFDLPQMERAEWAGELVQIAGSREDSYAWGSVEGGTLTQTLDAHLAAAATLLDWYRATEAAMPARQPPVLTRYHASDEWLAGRPLW